MKAKLSNLSVALLFVMGGVGHSMEQAEHIGSLPVEIKTSMEIGVFAPSKLTVAMIKEMWTPNPGIFVNGQSTFNGKFNWRGLTFEVKDGKDNIIDPHYRWIEDGKLIRKQYNNIEPILIEGSQSYVGGRLFVSLVYRNTTEATGLLAYKYDQTCIKVESVSPYDPTAMTMLTFFPQEVKAAEAILGININSLGSNLAELLDQVTNRKLDLHNKKIDKILAEKVVNEEIKNIDGAFNLIKMYLASQNYEQTDNQLTERALRLKEKEAELDEKNRKLEEQRLILEQQKRELEKGQETIAKLEDQVKLLHGKKIEGVPTFAIEAANSLAAKKNIN